MARIATHLLLLTVLLALCDGCSASSHEPAVPLRVRQKLVALYPGMAYVPSRLPKGYRYSSWDTDTTFPGGYRIVFVRNRPAREVTFSVDPEPYAAPGLWGANPNDALHVNGHTVYWTGGSHIDNRAWRWAWAHGRSILISADVGQARTDAFFVGYAEPAE